MEIKAKEGVATDTVRSDIDSDEPRFQDQSSRMPFRKILLVYLGIGEHFWILGLCLSECKLNVVGLALMVAFMDQTAVSTATPVIADDLKASATISWVGTAFFVGK